ncbi:protein PFC0760c-like [Pistacia vera]|uniref:protein PFC0760c-like n=1 Tax=Pistacia vera TaxID=55513 RepID=UPI0012634D2A|nr:protein PFC0760c-like [Pistacia vera]
MDFHSLARKELQTLCKKNKIPANMTNVAMADALADLEFVEGLDELMNQSQSPEKTTVTESPLIPRTANRTSTQRKAIKEDPETVQPMTRTRRTTRKTLDKDLEQENQNVNVGETPAVPASRGRKPAASASKKTGTQVKDNVVQEMSCGVETETPMVQTGRRRAVQVGSTSRKLEEEPVQRVYSTRRSVRLVEKSLADLSLKDEEKEESVKMDVLDETEEKDVSEVSLEKNNDSEVSSGVSFLQSLENERESEDEVHEDKSNEHGEEDCNVGTQNYVNSDNVSVLDAKDDNHDETRDASDELLLKHSNEIGPVDISETQSLSETENASIKVMEPEQQPLAAEESDEISAQVVEDIVPKDQIITSGKNSEADSDQFVANSIASPLNKQVAVECLEEESVHLDKVVATYSSDGPNVETDDEFESDIVVATNSSDQYITNSNATPLNMQVAVECVMNMQVAVETHDEFESDNATDSSDDPNVETDDEFDSDNGQTDDEFDSDNGEATYSSDDPNAAETDDEFDSDDELVDVQLTEAEAPISSSEGSVDVNLIEAEVPTSDGIKEEFDTEEIKEAEVSYENKTPKSVKQIDSISVDKTPDYRPMSPLRADSISGQFPRPTQSTQKHSSSKKQDTAQKLTLPAYNKENIDSSGMQLESKKEKTKDKNTTDEDMSQSLNEKSLRELTKMLKNQLQITNKKKNNEGQNGVKTRPALQALPENVMAGEPNKEN